MDIRYILLLLLCLILSGCEDTLELSDPNIWSEYEITIEEPSSSGYLWLTDTYPDNISFSVNNIEILFEWKDGKFNVVYDANNCSESAQVFFECMLPYLNSHIEDKARSLK